MDNYVLLNSFKMKRLILLLAVVSMSIAATAAGKKMATRATIDGISYMLNAKKEHAVVVKNLQQPYLGDIVIPERIEVDSVTFYVEEIAAGDFADCSGMT